MSTITKLANQDAVSSHTEIRKVAGFFLPPPPFLASDLFQSYNKWFCTMAES